MLVKESINLNFAYGLDTKTDSLQVQPGKLLSLSNGVFTKGGRLQKRNGNKKLALLPDNSYSSLTTFKGALTAIGTSLAAYSSGTDTWTVKGSLEPISLDVMSLIRSSTNQSFADCAIASNGLVCTVFTDQDPASLNTPIYKYSISDVNTGQNIVVPTQIPVTTGTVTNSPRVFVLSNYFVILFQNTILGVPHLQYVAISIASPTSVTVNKDITSQFVPTTTLAFDGIVVNNTLYVAWSGGGIGGSVKVTYIDSKLTQFNTATYAGHPATSISMSADTTPSIPVIYISYYDSNTLNGYMLAVRAAGTPASFTSVFSTGAPSITASSVAGLVIGQTIQDVTNPGNFSPNTTIANIVGLNVTLSSPTLGNSNGSPGDTIVQPAGVTTVLSPTQIITNKSVSNLGSYATNGNCTVYYEVLNNYGYDSSIPTHYINKVSCSVSGSVGPTSTVIRSLGLASKTFRIGLYDYFLAVQASTYQPTYFLINGSLSTQSSPVIVAKLAYQNGGGYNNNGLPSASVDGSIVRIPYLYKDLITTANKGTNLSAGTQLNAIYSQTGINLVSFDFDTQANSIVSAEIGNDLHITGGFLWMYDGFSPCEHNFFLYPENIEATPVTSGGGLKAQKYFYQVTYEWTDNQGNIFISAPSIPLEADLSGVTPVTFNCRSTFGSGVTTITVTSATGLAVGQIITDVDNPGNFAAGTYIAGINGNVITLSTPTLGASTGMIGDLLQTVETLSVTLNVPTLRLTYKTKTPVKITIYRWSTAQQEYYQVTSIKNPLLNSTTVDYVTFTDTSSDRLILGNQLLYTTGGVIENISAPATDLITLFDTRLWLVDSEDRNLLWFSKQVIEATPVEMSDLFTFYAAPTTGAQGSTGPITAISVLDDKLILFKKNAIYYINGIGPDNTGSNNQYSQPVFITSTVGCANQQSIVFMPDGLMFQSDKGIWLLNRNLGTSYIGAPVEQFNTAKVKSAVNVPETNQVRFTLDSGITLMYDYYYQQWGTFTGIPAISSTIYQSLSTFINSLGETYQENPGNFLDGSKPVLMSFQSAWFNFAGLQGFQRAYEFYLLGTYLAPHKLNVQICYDYVNSPLQANVITPDNYSAPWGGDPSWGDSSLWGGNSNIEQWRIFFQNQKCQAFSIIINELFDYTYTNNSGAGLIFHGIDLTLGLKSKRPKLSAKRQVG